MRRRSGGSPPRWTRPNAFAMLAYVIVVFCSSSPVPWMVQAAAAPVPERSPASLRADALDTRGASAGAPLLAAVAAVLLLAVAIFGCVARNSGNGDADDGGGDELKRLKRKCKKLEKENKAFKAAAKAAGSSGPEREFWSDGSDDHGGGGGGSKDGSDLKVPSETDIMVAQLGAVYTSHEEPSSIILSTTSLPRATLWATPAPFVTFGFACNFVTTSSSTLPRASRAANTVAFL